MPRKSDGEYGQSYLDEIFDWGKFELFVKEFYKSDGELIVERNVRERGKSGRWRQTDVKVTLKTKLHTYITLIECKRWKNKVDGDRVDVLAAKIEDLSASKGAIITTVGYEKGAELYAKHKNIDIFVVRELTEEEWGSPGRIIEIILQFFQGKVERISFPEAKLQPLISTSFTEINLNVDFTREGPLDDRLYLYSIKDVTRGPHVLTVISDYSQKIMKSISNKVQLIEGSKDAIMLILSNVELDLSNSDFKIMILPEGTLEINKITFELKTLIEQKLVRHDRALKYDLALIIENYITKQKNIISKEKKSPQIELSEGLEVCSPSDRQRYFGTVKKGEVPVIRYFFTFPWNFKLYGYEGTTKTNSIKLKHK
jgi:hypothetical protein